MSVFLMPKEQDIQTCLFGPRGCVSPARSCPLSCRLAAEPGRRCSSYRPVCAGACSEVGRDQKKSLGDPVCSVPPEPSPVQAPHQAVFPAVMVCSQ